MDQNYLLTLIPLCYFPAVHQGRNLHNPLWTTVVPQKYHLMVGHMHTHTVHCPSLPSWYLQALELLHRDHIEYRAGMSWRPRLCAVLLALQGTIMYYVQGSVWDIFLC